MVTRYLKDYVEDGRYTIVIGYKMKSLMSRIKELYPTAIITNSNADGIGGKKLLVDKLAADGLGLKAVLPKYRDEDVVYENFSKKFVEGDNVNVNFSSKGYEEWEQVFNQIKEQCDELYMDCRRRFFSANEWKQNKVEQLVGKPLTKEDVSFDSNSEVPKLFIKGQEVGVVSMSHNYVTNSDVLGTNAITFTYVTKDSPEIKVLSINRINGEVFDQ